MFKVNLELHAKCDKGVTLYARRTIAIPFAPMLGIGIEFPTPGDPCGDTSDYIIESCYWSVAENEFTCIVRDLLANTTYGDRNKAAVLLREWGWEADVSDD